MVRTEPGVAVVLALSLAAAMAACATPQPSVRASAAGPATPPPAEPTPTTGRATVVQSAWGRIWDAVPTDLLLFAGAQPVDIGEPVSAALDHPAEAASPEAIAQAYITDLTVGGWQVAMDGPLEDGSMVVDAVREGTSCRAQIRAAPLGGVVRITILYGADCARPDQS